MTATQLFYLIIALLLVNFIIDKLVDALNAKHFNDPVPNDLKDVFEAGAYQKSQRYKKEKYRFGLFTSSSSLIVTLSFFFLDGFEFVDSIARSISSNEITIALLFFGIILMASQILSIPLSYYGTFVIESKYGFNKTSLKTFVLDKLKGWVLGAVLGGMLLALIIWFYQRAGTFFWLYAWGLVALFSILLNLFYARLIVPLFNKQTPLENGSLRTKIEAYASKVGFSLQNIFVIDGSKRSTKANAYFSGFGKEKRITLYDTLINDLEEEEIVAVLAHEVGHYKRSHILYNLLATTLLTGFTLWLFSLFVEWSIFSEALGVKTPSFHVGLIAFGILYTPISEITDLIMNYLSRKFEYQADNYAKSTYGPMPLVASLKKLSRNSLSNLTPHPLYVFMHYSHPTLASRIQNLLQ
ncbi:MAG TPA: M48 family metallopeptidase [Flavobacteriaceae bacterium]|nr:M48 family metallopeptidase [Flavobacteriaceae bacterium]MCB9212418.1 M48 family metallopeptidase [Alteromonas sp.]HPF11694.1 M48 family metallopeptidase [Flavobacteriaceae bacterium]HQU20169.1 M48 family metallopeptidase [Flavobacteriaceae bacterium]HQU64742.1 M48 family metallopeptidase [Flavobacteriaceae bacterium]